MEKTLTFDVAVFDPTKEELQAIAQEVAGITADPTKITKEELELVNTTKNKLVKARTRIQEIGKEKRADALKFQKDVIAYEKELIAIIEPQELRLKEIESSAKEYATKQERLTKLPEYKQQLQSIGDDFAIEDETLLDMDPTQFQTYYNQRLSAHLEAQRIKMEEEREADRIAKEKEVAETASKLKEEADKLIREKEDIARREKELVDQKINLRINSLFELGLRFNGEAYVLDDINVYIVEIKTLEDTEFSSLIARLRTEIDRRKEAEKVKAEEDKQAAIAAAAEKAKQEAEAKAKQEADALEAKRQADEVAAKAEKEAKEKKEREESEERSKAEAFEKFLQTNGWTKENAKDFQTSYDNTTQVTTLYRKIGEYKHN